MRKILITLLFVVCIVKISQLNAYCIYNRSNEDTITVYAGLSKKLAEAPLLRRKSRHILRPGEKGCWNWKDLAEVANRAETWYWIAFRGKEITPGLGDKLGEGYFPVGGAIVFSGYDENARAQFKIYYDKQPWQYDQQPWDWTTGRPWKTYKR